MCLHRRHLTSSSRDTLVALCKSSLILHWVRVLSCAEDPWLRGKSQRITLQSNAEAMWGKSYPPPNPNCAPCREIWVLTRRSLEKQNQHRSPTYESGSEGWTGHPLIRENLPSLGEINHIHTSIASLQKAWTGWDSTAVSVRPSRSAEASRTAANWSVDLNANSLPSGLGEDWQESAISTNKAIPSSPWILNSARVRERALTPGDMSHIQSLGSVAAASWWVNAELVKWYKPESSPWWESQEMWVTTRQGLTFHAGVEQWSHHRGRLQMGTFKTKMNNILRSRQWGSSHFRCSGSSSNDDYLHFLPFL